MNERTRNFQGIRLLFLLGIAFMHADMPFIGTGWLMCTFFFVLSGFLFRQPENYGKYVKKKLLKTYPIYWFFFLLYLILYHFPLDIEAIPHFLLLQSFFPAISSNSPFYYHYLGPSWFLSSLLFCYIVSPFIYKQLHKLQKETVLLLLFTLLFLMIILRGNYTIYVPQGYGIWFFYISPFFRLLEYTLGIMLQIVIKDKEQVSIKGIDFISMFIIAFLIIYLRADMNVLFISGIFLFLIYFCYCYKSKLMDIIFGNKIVVTLAKYGLALYLGHQLLDKYFYNVCQLHAWPAILLAIVLSILVGFLYEKLVDLIKK